MEFNSKCLRMGGLGQGHLSFFFSKNHRLAREAGMAGGQKEKMLSVSNYQYILQNPFYYGIIRYNGEFYEGKHEPIITNEPFDECQKVMKRKSKPQKVNKRKFFLYRGLFKCGECGYTITADRKIKKSGKTYTYYYCTKKNPNHKCSQNVFTRTDK